MMMSPHEGDHITMNGTGSPKSHPTNHFSPGAHRLPAAPVGANDRVHFCRLGRCVASHLLNERGAVKLEGRIPTLLEGERGHGLSAHPGTAHRAGEVRRVNL